MTGKRKAAPVVEPAPVARTILDHLHDPENLGGLRDFKDLSTWRSWLVFLRAVFGLPMDAEDLAIFTKHTGRTRPSPTGYREAFAICGRQSGKSRIAATVGNFIAATAPMQETESYVSLVGQDERGATRTLLGYSKAVFRLPKWKAILRPGGLTRDSIRLANKVTIAAFPCRAEALRGYVNLATVVDEAAFFTGSDGHRTDVEVLRALRPSLATTGGRLIVLSSPYGQSGAVYEAFARYWGAEDTATLIWKASSVEMHPSLDPGYLAEMETADPEAYRSEILAEFRAGLSALFDPVALDVCTDHGTRERPPIPGVAYRAFWDGTSGRHDAAALTIWHAREDGCLVQDLARRWPAPHQPQESIAEAAALLRRYNIPEVIGDAYSLGFQVDAWAAYGLPYVRSAVDSSRIALESLGLVNSRRVLLLDEPAQRRELVGLERRRGPSGRDRVGHSRTPDDLAVAACGGMVLAAEMAPSGVTEEPDAYDRAVLDSFARTYGTPPPPGGWSNLAPLDDDEDNWTAVEADERNW